MKNAFAVSSLILTVGYPAVVAASFFGVVPLPVPSLFEFIGIYTSVGVIAFVLFDYLDRPRVRGLKFHTVTPTTARQTRVAAAALHSRFASSVPTALKAA
jgi:hypothetical protein